MQIIPGPIALANLELELFEAVFQGFTLAALASLRGVLRGNLLQILANQASQGRIAVHSDLADLFYEILVERKSHVHVHIISETLIM